MLSLRKRNRLFYLFVISILFSCSSNSQRSAKENLSCASFLNVNSIKWQNDSLGLKGDREKIADSLIKKCNFKGELWSKISNHFGPPFSQAMYDDSITTYKFRVNYFEQGKHSAIGNIFLLVEVINDRITLFKILEIDG